MRVVLQRVSRAEVRVAGSVTGQIGVGFVVLVGFAPADTEQTLDWMAEKILGLRLFGDAEGKMNLALNEVPGGGGGGGGGGARSPPPLTPPAAPAHGRAPPPPPPPPPAR